MSEQVSNAVTFAAFYTKDGAGVTGLTVTIDVWNPAGTEVVTAGSATEVGDGLYTYELASGSTGSAGEYLAVFKTAGDVDTAHLPSLWSIGRGGVENLDASVSSRLADADYSAPDLSNLDAAVSTRATPAQVTTIVGAIAGGGGSTEYTQNVTDDDDNPLDGVSVVIRTGESAALTPTATGTTDAFGNATFQLDPGTYYVWCQRAGIDFTNPTEIEVTA